MTAVTGPSVTGQPVPAPSVPASPAPADRSDVIVRAAYRVMSRRGVHRVPLTEVAREAGVSKGLVLYHHGSKDALVLAALEWVLTATADRLRAAIHGIDDARDKIEVVVDTVWSSPEANRDFFRFYLDGIEHQTRVDGFEQLGETARSIIEGLYAEVLESAMDAGVITRTDATELAATMRAIVEGFFLQWLQVEDWRVAHDRFRRRCSAAVLAVVR